MSSEDEAIVFSVVSCFLLIALAFLFKLICPKEGESCASAEDEESGGRKGKDEDKWWEPKPYVKASLHDGSTGAIPKARSECWQEDLERRRETQLQRQRQELLQDQLQEQKLQIRRQQVQIQELLRQQRQQQRQLQEQQQEIQAQVHLPPQLGPPSAPPAAPPAYDEVMSEKEEL